MLRSLVSRSWRSRCLESQRQRLTRRHVTTEGQQQDEPLRILFCGSESFSIAALRALHEHHKDPNSNIISIDVATRKDKAGGRGMKEVKSPQIKPVAAELGLRLHQFDTFTGWQLPRWQGSSQPHINLIVAVSFGLLVPPRILNSAKFGGLNVHPSMLPDLRGAAPIDWTILLGNSHTGVTVQTLHPSKFDHGTILAQTPQPGFAIPNPDEITAHELRQLLAPTGANMLVDAIRDRRYLKPYAESGRKNPVEPSSPLNSAPKITPSTRLLNPYEDDISAILRKNRAIPRLWAEASSLTDKGLRSKRIVFGTQMRAATMDDLSESDRELVDVVAIGTPFALTPIDREIRQSQHPLYLKVRDGSILLVPELLVAGDRERSAAAAAARAGMFSEPVLKGKLCLYQFQQQLTTPIQNA